MASTSKNIKNAAFLIIVISISILIGIIFFFVKSKEKYVNSSDTDINIIKFNCSDKPMVQLDVPSPKIDCTPGENPICLNHLLFSSKPGYVL
jgi:hypothetical protein